MIESKTENPLIPILTGRKGMLPILRGGGKYVRDFTANEFGQVAGILLQGKSVLKDLESLGVKLPPEENNLFDLRVTNTGFTSLSFGGSGTDPTLEIKVAGLSGKLALNMPVIGKVDLENLSLNNLAITIGNSSVEGIVETRGEIISDPKTDITSEIGSRLAGRGVYVQLSEFFAKFAKANGVVLSGFGLRINTNQTVRVVCVPKL